MSEALQDPVVRELWEVSAEINTLLVDFISDRINPAVLAFDLGRGKLERLQRALAKVGTVSA